MATKSNHLTALRGLLVGQGLNTPDDEIYASPVNKTSEPLCVYMTPAGGPRALNTFGVGGEAIQQPRIQVMVRGRDFAEVQDDANQIWSILHSNVPSGYSQTEMLQSEPLYLQQDADGRHMMSVNVQLYVYE